MRKSRVRQLRAAFNIWQGDRQFGNYQSNFRAFKRMYAKGRIPNFTNLNERRTISSSTK